MVKLESQEIRETMQKSQWVALGHVDPQERWDQRVPKGLLVGMPILASRVPLENQVFLDTRQVVSVFFVKGVYFMMRL